MNIKTTLVAVTVALSTLSSASVFAEGKTRAQVYQELVEAKQNGLDFVTDTSYPDVNPIYRDTVGYLKKQALAKENSNEKEVNAHESMLPRNGESAQ
jgi:hypothetical protein